MLASSPHRSFGKALGFMAMGSMLFILGPGCRDVPVVPAIAEVEPEAARPGTAVAIKGSGFSEKADDMVVKVGDTEVPAKRLGGDTLVIELPEHLEAGTYELTVGNRATEKASVPVELSVIDVVTIPAGTKLRVRIGTTLSSEKNQAGGTFPATLAQPLIAEGRRIAEPGSRVVGRITHAEASGRVKGVAELGFTLIELEALGGVRKLNLVTDNFYSRGKPAKKKDAAIIGGGAAAGAVIGGILGGKKGALKGAGVGGAAGTGAVLVTRGKQVEIPAGTEVTLTLRQAIELEIPPERVASSK